MGKDPFRIKQTPVKLEAVNYHRCQGCAMLNQPYTILIILALAMILFIWGFWRYDIIAILALAIATAVGSVPIKEVYSGLINPAVITVACVMIISKTIDRSGSINFLVNKISRISKYPSTYIGILSSITAILSAFMNNVGAFALMMPIAIQTAIKNKHSPALVLMPISLSSVLGGLLTLIGTPPNLLISSFRQKYTGKPFSMFDFAHVGFFVAFAGIVFLIFIGWRLIPAHKRKAAKSPEDIFQIEDYIAEVKVTETSPIVGLTIKDLEKWFEVECLLIRIIRNNRRRAILPPDLKIDINDIFIIEATPKNLQIIVQRGKLKLIGTEAKGREILNTNEISTMEAVISPGSRIEGRTTKSLRLKTRFGINLIAISREGKPFHERMNEVVLRAGDVLLLQGPADSLSDNISALGILPLIERNLEIGFKTKTWLPLLIFVIAIISSAVGWLPVQLSFAGAVLIMLLFRIIPVRLLYESIDWSIVILLAAMIPLGSALQSTGGTALITTFITSIAVHASSVFIIALLFIFTMTLSDFMNNAATAVVMAPIAVSIAQSLHYNIDPFLMTVAVASSCCFLTPIGHQNNTLIMGPGGYKFIDYIRVGLPLEIIILIIAVPTILWAWPL